ncbi:3-deoxy-manno-octulosonate cytidylyltransferase [Hirschia litorea]|uniref:3-deoxy-manno-octulosonate cytidylyltransferase n=1 Tax=Hirschia litorea TaxID=1199156 RepID=A0ABW2ILU3_9PROT
MKSLIVIPSRYASKRFPAKPLHKIAGHTLLSRVVNIAQRVCAADSKVSYVVATDDTRIEAHAKEIGAPVVMTDPNLASGTDRALAATNIFKADADFIVNLQGDAPFTPPEHVHAIINAGKTSRADVVTPVLQMPWDALDIMREQKQIQPFSGTSCVRRRDGEALWFSKNILPAIRKEDALRSSAPLSPVWRHIGLYGYTRAALARFTSLPEGYYEKLEGLEQLRFLENGMRIMTVAVQTGPNAMWGVDTLDDAEHAEKLIAQHGDPLDMPTENKA